MNIESSILTIEEAAAFLKVSVPFLYKGQNWRKYGGRKVGGQIRFPSKEDIYERVFHLGEENQKRERNKGKKGTMGVPIQKGEISKPSSIRHENGSGGSRVTEKDGSATDDINYTTDIFDLFRAGK